MGISKGIFRCTECNCTICEEANNCVWCISCGHPLNSNALQKEIEAARENKPKPYKVISTLEERVARALTIYMNGKKQDLLPKWEDLPNVIQKAYMEQARDVLDIVTPFLNR